ncbi:MAG: ABC transporter ATP-binding protein [Paracoccaceae bacterium]|nr:ABC transporter ATP-binding protein [Paracoccaceae bacterium]
MWVENGSSVDTSQQTAAIEIRNAAKHFGDFVAIRDASLTIFDNEFFTLLGPSGCGKTTLLRLIAGFEDVTEGEIFLYGEEIEQLPPNRRPVNTVFQHYALFPHMTVAENVGFGLLMKGVGKREAALQVRRMLALVKLDALADRRPSQLSGGQQQRAALARAIAPGPKVLLLDEPLSALDLKLRQAMRVELKQLQQETGITFVFVTHDQEEALAMSDRIAVMSDGVIQQIGSAREIYDRPVNRFVANFIGETNLLDITILGEEDGRCRCSLPNGVTVECRTEREVTSGAVGHILIRPERIGLDPESDGSGDRQISGTIEHAVYLGTDTQYAVAVDGGLALRVRRQNGLGTEREFSVGDRVNVRLEEGAVRLLDD